MNDWIKRHGAAVTALAGAGAAFLANVDPTVGDLVGGYAAEVATLAAFVGAVAHGYVQGAGDGNGS